MSSSSLQPRHRSPYAYTPQSFSSKSRRGLTDSLPAFLFVLLIIFVYVGKTYTGDKAHTSTSFSKTPHQVNQKAAGQRSQQELIQQDHSLRNNPKCAFSTTAAELVNGVQNKYAQYLEKKRVVIIHEEVEEEEEEEEENSPSGVIASTYAEPNQYIPLVQKPVVTEERSNTGGLIIEDMSMKELWSKFTPAVFTGGLKATDSEKKCKRCIRFGNNLLSKRCLAADCPVLTSGDVTGGKLVISTSLYGGDLRYTGGAIRNAEIFSSIFPGWELRFYIKDVASVPHYVINEIKDLGAVIYPVPDDSIGFGMNWRFIVADDPTVEAFICRDADSRVSLRDRYAIDDWLKEGDAKPFHVVRDHPSHAALPIMGGTWGARRSGFVNRMGTTLTNLLSSYVSTSGDGKEYMADINFLSHKIWPAMLQHGVVQHDSHSCQAGRHGPDAGRAWPRPRAGTEHVGAVYLFEGPGASETARDIDLDLIRRQPEPAACQPQGTVAGKDRKSLGRTFGEFVDVIKESPSSGAAVSKNAVSLRNLRAQPWRVGPYRDLLSTKCLSSILPSYVIWTDAFIDHEMALKSDGSPYSAVFDYESHFILGSPPVLTASDAELSPPQYHERMPNMLEPIQALNGGVRYYQSLIVLDAAYGPRRVLREDDNDSIDLFFCQDFPNMHRATSSEAILLLPKKLYEKSMERLAALKGTFLAQEYYDYLVSHILEQEPAPALYYAPSVYVFGATVC